MNLLQCTARSVRRRLHEMTDHGRDPLVTVVVVARGSASALGDCLASVLGSSHRSLQVLLVAEPGSSAATTALALVDLSDPRVHRLPAGCWLDDAVDAASGELLTFVDSDGTVPPAAYASVVRVLTETGSDLVVGSQQHAVASRTRPPAWQDLLFSGPRLRQSVDSCPHALVDLALTNKMFRTSLWRSLDLALRSWHGCASAVARAYLGAATFDVLPMVVSTVHARDVSLPIEKQARFSAGVARARLDALLETAALVRSESTELWHIWSIDVVEHLLPPMYVDAVGGGRGYFEVLSPTVRHLISQMRPESLRQVTAHPRVASWVAAHGSLLDVALMQDLVTDNPHGLPTHDAMMILPEDLSSVPPEGLRRLEQVDRRLRVFVNDFVEDGSGQFRLEGAAFVDYEAGGLPDVTLFHPSEHTLQVLAVQARRDPSVNEWAARAWEDRSNAGFVALLDPAVVAGRPRWHVEVTLGGLSQTLVVRTPEAIAVEQPAAGVRVLEAKLEGLLLRLSGTTSHSEVSMRLESRRGGTAVATAVVERDRFEVALELTTALFGETAALPSGPYRIEATGPRGGRIASRCARDLLTRPPELISTRHRVTFEDIGQGAAVVLGPPLHQDERSVFGQQQLTRGVYAAPTTSTYDRTVLLETFRGRSVGDNPGALCRELLSRQLGLDLVWVVDDPSVNVPVGTRAVVRRTREWHALLGAAHGYVANAGAPHFFTKPPGQFHLQTWHGTPLKRIGEDRGPGDFNTWRHRRQMARQADGWDAMLSPSPYCTEIFRSAFRFDNTMLESGYPRNDVLLAEDAGDVRQRVRSALGLRGGDRVVLYAPTWREYVGVRDAKPLYLDAEMLTAALPDTVVLVRGHYNSTGRADVFAEHPRIHDVTRYPDIADLYLAADVLVTDYSSVMFDFALTDKPMVLLTPDLVRYRDVERGFYFDIESLAPAPMVESTEQVMEVLDGPDLHAQQRATFRAKFCPFDDGHASRRVVDDLLARW